MLGCVVFVFVFVFVLCRITSMCCCCVRPSVRSFLLHRSGQTAGRKRTRDTDTDGWADGSYKKRTKSTSKEKGELELAPLAWSWGRKGHYVPSIGARGTHTHNNTPLAPHHTHPRLHRASQPVFSANVLSHSHMSNLRGSSLRRPLISGETMHPRSGTVWQVTDSRHGERARCTGVPCEVHAPILGDIITFVHDTVTWVSSCLFGRLNMAQSDNFASFVHFKWALGVWSGEGGGACVCLI